MSRFLDSEESYEERKGLVEYQGFFANPEVYYKVKESEAQTSRVDDFDAVAREMREEARKQKPAPKKMPPADLEIDDQDR